MNILNDGKEIDFVNGMEIVLVQKNQNPTKMANFRPISLCTILYKIVAKVIVNSLQGVIRVCIDSTQCAFIPNKLISDNVLLAYEILHTFRQKRTKKKAL